MEAFLVSTAVVGLAEIGDKTQILSLMLAARFQRPLPIIFGIFFATIANHAAAGLAGTYFGNLLSGLWMRWILGISFLSVAVWALFPDKVVIGTTLGMMLANIPAVLIGDRIADKLPVKAIRVTAALVFAALGVITLAGVDG